MNQPQESQEAPKGRKRIDPKWVLRVATASFKRRWLTLGIGFVVALAIGVVGSWAMTAKVWRATTLLLYTAPPIPDEIRGMQGSLQLDNVGGFVTARPVLNQIHSELNFPYPIHLMEKSIVTQTSRNTDTIFVSMEWGDPTEAKNVLERLNKIYPKYIATIRQDIAKGHLREVEQQLMPVRARLDSARKRHAEFTREHKIIDFKNDMLLILSEVSSLDTNLKQLQRDEQSMKDQLKLLDDQLGNAKAAEEEEAKASQAFKAAEESLIENRARQNRLRELIIDERSRLETEAKLKVHKKALERANALFEKQLISKSELKRARGQVESLMSRINESDKIGKWKKELEALDKLVVPVNKKVKKQSPIITQIQNTKFQVEMKILHGQRSQKEITNELRAKKAQISTYQEVRTNLDKLNSDIEMLDDERQVLEHQAKILRQLVGFGPIEFSIVSPPSTGQYPISSNRKKMFILLTAGVMFLVVTMLAALDYWREELVPVDATVEYMGLPVVSRLKTGSDDEATPSKKEIRELALRLRQSVDQAGAVVMISSLVTDQSLRSWIHTLAKCFAARDERVIIVDARHTEDGLGEFADVIDVAAICGPDGKGLDDVDLNNWEPMGIHDWLGVQCFDPDEIIFPTSRNGVDCILPGQQVLGEDFATNRMNGLIEVLRVKYSLVILISPEASYATDVQILASYADALLFTFEAERPLDAEGVQTVETLMELQAPMVGAVQA